MPPKTTSSNVYLVVSSSNVDSVHATIESANERVAETKGSGTFKVEVQTLHGGSVQVEEKKSAAKQKAKKDETAAPKAPKTKSAKEQRAANASKGTKSADEDLPDKVQDLLSSTSDALSGLIIVVTGVPPTIGRKNAEKLVQVHGGKLGKSITGKTNLVVLGNDAGPKKLEEIEKLQIETVDEDGLIERLESGDGGTKRPADDESSAKIKKQKK